MNARYFEKKKIFFSSYLKEFPVSSILVAFSVIAKVEYLKGISRIILHIS